MKTRKLYPLSKAQEEILRFEVETFQGTAINVQCFAFRLRENYPDRVIEEAYNAVMEHEQALRLRIVADVNGYWQEEAPYEAMPLPVIDCTDLEPGRFEEKLREQTEVFLAYSDYPLHRFTVYRGKEETAVTIVGHHITFDLWSAMLTAYKLELCCKSLAEGKTPELEYHCYTDICQREAALLQSERYLRDRQYWKEKFTCPAPLARLMPDRPASRDTAGKRIQETLTPRLTEKLLGICGEMEMSPSTLFQTAIFLWLYHKNPQIARIDTGYMALGRRSKLEKAMLGNFAQETLICIPAARDLTVRELIGRIRFVTAEAFYHSLVLHDDILELARETSPGLSLIRDLEFGYVPACDLPGEVLNFQWLTEEDPETSAEYLVLHSGAGELTVFFHYRQDLFSPEEGREAFDGILRMLEACIDAPDGQIDRLL